MNTKKVLAEHNLFRTLKIVSYLIGFPLFLLLLMQSAYYMGFGVKSTPVKTVLVAWAIVAAVQIVLSFLIKTYTLKAVIVSVVSVAILLGGTLSCTSKCENTVNDAREEYVRQILEWENGLTKEEIAKLDIKSESVNKDGDIVVKNGDEEIVVECPIADFSTHLREFKPWSGGTGITSGYMGVTGKLTGLYNCGSGSVTGSKNTDGSSYGEAPDLDEDGKPDTMFGETGKVYSANGLYADGYIFGVEPTIQILLTIHKTEKDYGDTLETTRAAAKAAAMSDYLDYCANSEEYEAAYGEDGTINSYMITEDRLLEILDTVLSKLGKSINDDPELKQKVKDLLDEFGFGFAADLIKFDSLSVDKIFSLLGTLGIEGLDKESILGMVMPLVAAYSNYQSPSVLPWFYFIPEEYDEIRTYEYAMYYAETHGANVGCVLYSSDPNGKIGKITMSDSGTDASDGLTVEELIEIRVKSSYSGTVFPLLLARRYAMFLAGFSVLSVALFYFFAFKQKMCAARLVGINAVAKR